MSESRMTHSCDVAVIGGGPAGSTAAYALAKKGWRVVLFEKERHPRFHIGESLLPMNQPVFEQIGVLDEVERIGVYKPGAEFYDVDPKQPPHRFYFRDALDKNFPDAYQVRRDQLDEVLLRNCERNGATVCEESRVTAVDFAADGAGATLAVQPKQGDAQTWAARYVVDASGRDAMLGGKFGIKRKNQRHASAAIFGHFDGVPRNPGPEAGLISVCWFEHGWIWFIPLPDGMMSVGAVCSPAYLKTRRGSTEDFLAQTLAMTPPHVQQRMADAKLVGEVRAAGNYSYQCERMCFPGAILVGDAWAFVDPVFSSGVLLGMRAALRGADYVDAELRGAPEAVALRESFERISRRSVKDFTWMIARFNSPGIRHLFTNPGNPWRVQEAVTSLLAGDVERDNGVRPRLMFFRGLYYFFSVLQLPAAIREWFRRRARVRVMLNSDTGAAPEA